MSKLRAPLRNWLDDRLPEEQVQRMWRKLIREPSRHLRWTLLGAGAAFSLSAALWLGLIGLRPLSHSGPIGLVGQAPLTAARSFGGERPVQLALNDGSRIELAGRANLDVLENNDQSFVLQLRKGQAHFDVEPGGPRRWLIECGAASVEVVGTEFSIDRDEQAVRVSVSRGVVLVRGAQLPNRVQRLTAKQTLRVPAEATERASSAAPQSTGRAIGTLDASAVDGRKDNVEPHSAHSWPSAEPPLSEPQPSAAEPAKGVARRRTQLEPLTESISGAAVSPVTLASWLKQADRARRKHEPARAEQLLERVLAAAPRSAHGAVAAFTLARMQLPDEPGAAAETLSRALAAALPEALQEDALAMLVEARARNADRESAQAAARQYAERYPKGRRQGEVRRWATGP
jgi:transmembrane sensor